MIPADMPSRVNTAKIEELFGGGDMVLIMFETDDIINKESLKRIKKIAKALERIKDVNRIMSPFNSKKISGDDGMMIVEPAIKRLPRNEKAIAQLKQDIKENNLVYGLTISKDFKMVAIIAQLEKDADQPILVEQIEKVLEENPGIEDIYIGGLPFVKKAITADIIKDVRILIPAAIMLMLGVLFISFRKLYGVLLPFGVVILSIFFGMGLLPVFGWQMALVTILLPILIISIANNYGIHLVTRFQELQSGQNNSVVQHPAITTYNHLKYPVLLTGLTTIAGILGLLSHIIVPAKQVGVLAALGIAWALLLSLFFIPSVLSFVKKVNTSANNEKRKSKLVSFLQKTATQVSLKPKRVIASFIAITLITGAGIIWLKVDGNNENFFKEKHIVKQSAEKINKHFGGTQNISVVFNGDIKNPELLNRMDRYEQILSKTEGVGNVISIASVLKEMSKALNDPDEEYYDEIPPTREAVAQYLELYNMNGDPEDFEQMVDFDYENAHMIIRINNSDSYVVMQVVDRVKELLKNEENAKIIGGYGLISAEITQTIIKGQIISLVVAIIVITILLMLIFKSFTAGIIGSIPLVMAITLLFGLMGFAGIPLDAATAMLSSIMIGIGVDYTIHFLWRYKSELKKGNNEQQAVITTLTSTGKGIVFNALSVMIGFSALLFSSFLPIKFFGFLVIISILTCLIAALIFVPAICMVWKPTFLYTKNSSNNEKQDTDNTLSAHSIADIGPGN